MPSSPVVPVVVPSVLPSVGMVLVVVPSLELSPRTLMAFPVATIGATMSGITWLPLAIPSSPVVALLPAVAEASVIAGVLLPELSLSPRIEMALPPMVTGNSPRIPIWLPDAVPSSPEVSAACAAPAPRTVRPPTKNAPQSARETTLFMISLLETDGCGLFAASEMAGIDHQSGEESLSNVGEFGSSKLPESVDATASVRGPPKRASAATSAGDDEVWPTEGAGAGAGTTGAIGVPGASGDEKEPAAGTLMALVSGVTAVTLTAAGPGTDAVAARGCTAAKIGGSLISTPEMASVVSFTRSFTRFTARATTGCSSTGSSTSFVASVT